MLYETLITRYKNIGYEPKGLEPYLELESICNWIYEKFDVYIYMTFHDKIEVRSFNKISKGQEFNTFGCHKVWCSSEEHANKIYCENYFNNPFDAKFDTLRRTYKSIKFQYC